MRLSVDALIGRPSPSVLVGAAAGTTAPSPFHAQAKAALEQAFRSVLGREGTPVELQGALGVSLGEGGYGTWTYFNHAPLVGMKYYGDPSLTRGGGAAGDEKSEAAGKVIRVTGTWNWGASQCGHRPPCGEGCVEITDSSPHMVTASNPHGGYQACLKLYPDQAAGAVGYLRTLALRKLAMGDPRNPVLEALGTGSADAIAKAMYDTKYYQGFSKDPAKAIDTYAAGIFKNAGIAAKGLGEAPLVTRGMPPAGLGPSAPSSGRSGGGAAGALFFGGLLLGGLALAAKGRG